MLYAIYPPNFPGILAETATITPIIYHLDALLFVEFIRE